MRCLMLSIFLCAGLQLSFGQPLTHVEINRPKVEANNVTESDTQSTHYSGLGRPANVDPSGENKRGFTNAHQGQFPFETIHANDVESTTHLDEATTTTFVPEITEPYEENGDSKQKRSKRGIYLGAPYVWRPQSLMKTFGLELHNGGISWNRGGDSYDPYETYSYDSYPESIEDENDNDNEDSNIEPNKIGIYEEHYYNNNMENGFNYGVNQIHRRLPNEDDLNEHVNIILNDVHSLLRKDPRTDKDQELKDIKSIVNDKDFIKRGVIMQTNPKHPVLNILEGNFTSIIQNNFSISDGQENKSLAHKKDKYSDVPDDIGNMKEKVDDESTSEDNAANSNKMDTDTRDEGKVPNDNNKIPDKDDNDGTTKIEENKDVAGDVEEKGDDDDSNKDEDENTKENEADKTKEDNASNDKAEKPMDEVSKTKGNEIADLAQNEDFRKFVDDMIKKYVENMNEESKPKTENQIPEEVENVSRKRKPRPNGNYNNEISNNDFNKYDKKNKTTINNYNNFANKDKNNNNKTESNVEEQINKEKDKDEQKPQTESNTHKHVHKATNIYNFVGQSPKKIMDVLKPMLHNKGVHIFNFGSNDISKDFIDSINKDEVIIPNKEDINNDNKLTNNLSPTTDKENLDEVPSKTTENANNFPSSETEDVINDNKLTNNQNPTTEKENLDAFKPSEVSTETTENASNLPSGESTIEPSTEDANTNPSIENDSATSSLSIENTPSYNETEQSTSTESSASGATNFSISPEISTENAPTSTSPENISESPKPEQTENKSEETSQDVTSTTPAA